MMRACQVVGEKGVYKALVDAVDDAGSDAASDAGDAGDGGAALPARSPELVTPPAPPAEFDGIAGLRWSSL